MPTAPDQSTSSGYTYTTPIKPKPTRVWLAIIVCGILAAVTVTIIALLLMLVAQLFGSTSSLMGSSRSGPVSGSVVAIMLCLYNLVLFPIVLPITWGGMALSLGRLRWKGKNERKPYYIRGIVLGTVLVGLTTGIFGSLDGELLSGLSATITGSTIGGLAGAFCTFIFLKISRPAQIIGDAEVNAFS